MKTKLSKKSIAAALAAIVLSSGAFLGISLSLSQNADASCEVKKDGKTVFKCDGNEGNCKEELEKTKLLEWIFPGEITIECSGEKVAIKQDDKDNDPHL